MSLIQEQAMPDESQDKQTFSEYLCFLRENDLCDEEYMAKCVKVFRQKTKKEIRHPKGVSSHSELANEMKT